MRTDEWLVALGAGRWQVPGIRAARGAGLKVLAVDADPNAPGLGAADVGVSADIRDASAVIPAIEKTGLRISGAIAFCNEAGMLAAAAVREHFDLPGPRTGTTKALTDKGVQRARWTEASLPCPRWSVVRSAQEVPGALARIAGRAIFKPVDSAGSRGVAVVGKDEPWEKAYDQALVNSRSGSVIIESFIKGIEHTVETFSHRGETHILAVTAKKKVSGTSETVASELATARLDDKTSRDVEAIATKALAALGYTDGPGHTEFLLNDAGEIYLVESAGRGGGFMVADGLVPCASGFQLARACALQAVGREPELPPRTGKKSAVLRFLPSRPGKVVSIKGFDTEHDMEGVVCQSLVEVGQDLGKAATDGDRMALILACAATIEEAQARADTREARLQIVIQ